MTVDNEEMARGREAASRVRAQEPVRAARARGEVAGVPSDSEAVIIDESALMEFAAEHPLPAVAGTWRTLASDLPEAIASLRKGDDPSTVCALIGKARKSEIETEALLIEIQKRTGVSKRVLQRAVQAQRPKGESPQASKSSKALMDRLTAQLGRPLTLPPGDHFLMEVDGRPWVAAPRQDGSTERLFTAAEQLPAAVYVDRDGHHAKRVRLLTSGDEWVTVDVEAGELAGPATELIRRLLRAGMAMTDAGERVIKAWLKESQPPTILVVHRPGLRRDAQGQPAWVLPTGEVIQ